MLYLSFTSDKKKVENFQLPKARDCVHFNFQKRAIVFKCAQIEIHFYTSKELFNPLSANA